MYKRFLVAALAALLFVAAPMTAKAEDVTAFSAQMITMDGETPGGEEDPPAEPEKPLVLNATLSGAQMATYKSIKLTWTPLADASGYVIYRSTSKLSGYKALKTITGGTVSTYTDKSGLKTAKKYYYKIQAYGFDKAGVKQVGALSAPLKIQCTLPATKISSIKATSSGVKLKWKKVSGADGYIIYRKAEDGKKFKKLVVIESGKKTSYVVPASDANGTNTYMIKAYRKNGKKKILAVASNEKAATVNLYASASESYTQKCQRAFGTNSYQTYASPQVAASHMKSVTVKVWDVGALGIKVTRTKTFSVNAGLAPTIEQIFKEIYEGKEKFPIKSVGGYSWRGSGSRSEHNQGTALDINPNENMMIEGNGTISSGSLWKPGSNVYSIPANGEVVKIFAKYGFRWGGLGWPSGRKDYMHFSYFGT